MNKIINIGDHKAQVEGGITYGELSLELKIDNKYALSNLASLLQISIGGGISTGTHGSGSRN
jgi:xylitol oxidase